VNPAPRPPPLTLKGFLILAVAGFLVGFGTRYAGGCTSGHAISGLSDLQLPSLIAVIGFFTGGQFAHRFAYFAQRPQCDRIVAASSGWYIFHRAVGANDTDPNSSDLRHTAEADTQGINRVQRANFAYQTALDQCAALGSPCGWSLHLEPGVAHSAQAMGAYALTYLYP